MSNKWVVGLLAVLSVAALVGVGYSAFTATANVNGTASAGVVALQVTPSYASGCYYPGGAPAPGQIVSSDNPANTVVSLSIVNLVPGGVCSTVVYVYDTGSVPLVLNNQLNETGGICVGPGLNCYDVYDTAGLNSAAPITNVNSITTLAPGGSPYIDIISVYIPAGSTAAPPTGSFTVFFTGSAGL